MSYYEYRDAKSHKFWEITLAGTEVTTRWGRVGAKGQTKTKSYADEEAAAKDAEKQTRSKTKKGYVETGDDDAVAPLSGYVARFRKMVETLERHDDVRVVRFEVGDPATTEQISAVEEHLGAKLSPVLRSLYTQANGLVLAWTHPGDEGYDSDNLESDDLDNDWVGIVQLLPLDKVYLTDGEGETWHKDLYGTLKEYRRAGHTWPSQEAHHKDLRLFDRANEFYPAAITVGGPEVPFVLVGDDHGATFEDSDPATVETYLEARLATYGAVQYLQELFLGGDVDSNLIQIEGGMRKLDELLEEIETIDPDWREDEDEENHEDEEESESEESESTEPATPTAQAYLDEVEALLQEGGRPNLFAAASRIDQLLCGQTSVAFRRVHTLRAMELLLRGVRADVPFQCDESVERPNTANEHAPPLETLSSWWTELGSHSEGVVNAILELVEAPLADDTDGFTEYSADRERCDALNILSVMHLDKSAQSRLWQLIKGIDGNPERDAAYLRDAALELLGRTDDRARERLGSQADQRLASIAPHAIAREVGSLLASGLDEAQCAQVFAAVMEHDRWSEDEPVLAALGPALLPALAKKRKKPIVALRKALESGELDPLLRCRTLLFQSKYNETIWEDLLGLLLADPERAERWLCTDESPIRSRRRGLLTWCSYTVCRGMGSWRSRRWGRPSSTNGMQPKRR
ncbi:MAG: WGR domain-containing protein [Deltaproteobacteria bacterium]|nr:WGR domain-containing protein [Deltaproteobacteria bacterium]